MDVQRLFSIQKHLDDRILAEHGLNAQHLFQKKILALQVELAELANETRAFKYWSRKSPAPRERILEEYVDAVHFVLSLGLDLGCRDDLPLAAQAPDGELTELFIELNAAVIGLAKSKDRPAYEEVFAGLLALGAALGFSPVEVESAYLCKNEENHRRQNEGY